MSVDGVAALVALIITLILIIYLFKIGVRNWYSPYVFLCFLTFNIFFLRPLLLVFGLDVPYPEYLFYELQKDIFYTQCYVIVWLSSIVFFTVWFERRKRLAFERLLPSAPQVISLGRLRVVVAVLTALTAALAVKNYGQFGSYSDILIAAKIDKELSGTTVVRQIPGLSMLVSAIYLCESLKRRVYLDAMLSIFAITVAIGVYYMWGAREAVAIVFLGFVLLLSIEEGGRKLKWIRIGAGAAAMLFLSTYVYISRLESLGASEDAINSRDLITTICISFHMTRYDSLMLQVRDWDYYLGLRYGYDIAIGNLSVIPRFLWDSKPDQILPGAWFRQMYEPYAINGWPFSVVGEWLISFWVFGLVLGGGVAAYIYKSIDNKYRDSHGYFSYFTTIFICLTVVQNGSVLQLFPEYVLWVLPLILVGFLVRGRGEVQ